MTPPLSARLAGELRERERHTRRVEHAGHLLGGRIQYPITVAITEGGCALSGTCSATEASPERFTRAAATDAARLVHIAAGSTARTGTRRNGQLSALHAYRKGP
jgi:hypothetical protein